MLFAKFNKRYINIKYKLTFFNFFKEFRCVAAKKSLILKLFFYFPSALSVIKQGPKMLVISFINFIIIAPTHFISLYTFSAESYLFLKNDFIMFATKL